MKSIFLSLLWSAGVVRSAIIPDDTQAVESVADNDASPIDDMATYYPDQHDCPLQCEDLTNTNSWITHFSVERLSCCNETMLLQFSVTQPLDRPDSTILIRSCSLGSSNGNRYRHEVEERISVRQTLSNDWSACLQTLEGHSNNVNSVSFSHDCI